MYTPAQLDRLKTILRNYNHFCGYAHTDESDKDETTFFTYPANLSTKAKDEIWTTNKGYLELNR